VDVSSILKLLPHFISMEFRLMTHRAPRPTQLDVRRIICRDFSSEETEYILRKLELYGAEPWHVEKERVHLAILRLANGDSSEVERNVAIAIADYRDVLAEAEYPEQYKLGFVGMDSVPPSQVVEIEQRDRKQYQDWLNAPA
jgi:hypothetical protein